MNFRSLPSSPVHLTFSLKRKSYFYSFFAAAFLSILLSGHTYATQNPAITNDNEKREEIGRQFATALMNQDSQTLKEMIDFDSLFLPAAKAVTSTKEERLAFLNGVKRTGIPNLLNSLIQSIERADGDLAFKRLILESDDMLPLLRLDSVDGGIDFILLTLNKKSLKVTDIHMANSGRFMSEQFKEMVALMMPPSKSLFSAIFKSFTVDEEVVNAIKEVGRLNRLGMIKQSYKKLASLPENARNSRPILNLAIQLSQHIGNDVYLSELERLATHHGDEPSLQLMLIDYYFLTEDFEAAKIALDSLSTRFGPDAAINNLKANLNLATNTPLKAVEYANQAIELEMDNEAAHWTLVTSLVLAEDYVKVPKSLDRISEQFGYTFSRANFEGEELYAGFIKSQAFKDWMKD